MPDVPIRGGWVANGIGNPGTGRRHRGAGDRRARQGRLPRLIDAEGNCDSTLFANPTQESTIRQGVTTEIFGGGNSFAPVCDRSRSFIVGRMRGLADDGPVEWSSFGTTCNFAYLGPRGSERTGRVLRA